MSIGIEPSTAETHTGGRDTTDIHEHFPVSLQLIPRAPLLHLVAGMETQDAAGVELAAASTLASPRHRRCRPAARGRGSAPAVMSTRNCALLMGAAACCTAKYA
jgi:hypothetical protein